MQVNPVANSLIVPVYGNSATIDALVDAVSHIAQAVDGGLETIFVVDGSPDDSRIRLVHALQKHGIRSRVVDHSRNFGAFAAVRTGMAIARGDRIAVMAADLQEPPELVIEFLRKLASGDVDVVAGERAGRADRDLSSRIYWRLYRRFVVGDMPPAGVDVFGCTAAVRDVVCSLESVHTSLVAQLFWVGFRREMVPYERLARTGKSGWTLRSKSRYLLDSVFAFTDLPVRVLWGGGIIGLVLGTLVGLTVLIARAFGAISVPGYAATVLVIVFFGSLNLIGLGIIGSYVWRGYETAKGRPGAIVSGVLELPEPDSDV